MFMLNLFAIISYVHGDGNGTTNEQIISEFNSQLPPIILFSFVVSCAFSTYSAYLNFILLPFNSSPVLILQSTIL